MKKEKNQKKKKSNEERFVEVSAMNGCGIDATDEIFNEKRVGGFLKNPANPWDI